jgi:uncharacterized membrane protein SirB2
MNKHPLLRYLFIASLISIFLQLFSLTINIIKNPKEKLLKDAEKYESIKPEIAEKMRDLAYEYETNKYFKIMPYLNFLFLFTSGVGVVLMWQLKKVGWYIYLFAEFMPYVLSIFTWEDYSKYNIMFGGEKSLIVYTFVLLAFDILFAGLYFYALRESEKLNAINANTDSDSSQL